MVNPVDPFGFTLHTIIHQARTSYERSNASIAHTRRTREEQQTALRRTAHAHVQHACITELATLAFAPQFALIARYERANAPRRASSQAMTHVTGTGSFIRLEHPNVKDQTLLKCLTLTT